MLTGHCADAMLDAMDISSGTRLLDVCTGPGVFARGARKRGATAIGLDFSDKLLAIARRNVPDAEFRQGDAHDLPFDDDSFDAVVCGFGLMHLPQPDVALREMHRVLQPGGRLGIAVWDAPTPGNGLGVLYGAIRAHGDVNTPLPHGPDFFQFAGPGDMTEALESTGLRDVAVHTVTPCWEFAHPSDLIKAIEEGAVRARALLLAQTDEARKSIESAVEDAISQFRSDDGTLEVPMPAVLGIAGK
jgi:SAM-dependent methyltransferase